MSDRLTEDQRRLAELYAKLSDVIEKLENEEISIKSANAISAAAGKEMKAMRRRLREATK